MGALPLSFLEERPGGRSAVDGFDLAVADDHALEDDEVESSLRGLQSAHQDETSPASGSGTNQERPAGVSAAYEMYWRLLKEYGTGPAALALQSFLGLNSRSVYEALERRLITSVSPGEERWRADVGDAAALRCLAHAVVSKWTGSPSFFGGLDLAELKRIASSDTLL